MILNLFRISDFVLRIFKKRSVLNPRNDRLGFTLVEITLVVGILVVLSAIVLVTLNIRGNRANAQNVQRKMDMETIQKALDLRAQDTGESLPSGLNSGLSEVCIGTGSGCYNLTTDLTPLYLGTIPKDPKDGTDANTGYLISVDPATKVVCVKAPGAENDEVIENCRK
ncbi:MAG TPA: type II secretion system protein [Patescibacteria group bacterium]|nr:type II secretion system protein [Patescibacteria group bacterium]